MAPKQNAWDVNSPIDIGRTTPYHKSERGKTLKLKGGYAPILSPQLSRPRYAPPIGG